MTNGEETVSEGEQSTPEEEVITLDARKATHLVRDYFQDIHGNWMLMFRIENVERNTDPQVWKVTCNFFTSPGQQKPLKYFVKVNVSDGNMIEVRELK